MPQARTGRSKRSSYALAALAALAASGAAACGIGGRADGDAAPTAPPHASATRTTAGDAAAIFAQGVISDAREQWRITFTPDGKTAYFASSAGFFPFTRQATIYVSHLVGGAWSAPEVASFSGRYSDIDLWMVERTPDGWGEPIWLGPNVNSPTADELYPSVSAAGTLYFASGPFFPQPGRHYDIYSAERQGDGFAPRVALGAGVNTAPVAGGGLQDAWEFNPEISVDGRTLVFTSLRPGGFGLGDLYVSHLERGAWTPARNLGPLVNTAADEYHPTLSRDRRTLWFVRRGPAPGNFYQIATRGLEGF